MVSMPVTRFFEGLRHVAASQIISHKIFRLDHHTGRHRIHYHFPGVHIYIGRLRSNGLHDQCFLEHWRLNINAIVFRVFLHRTRGSKYDGRSDSALALVHGRSETIVCLVYIHVGNIRS